MTFRLLRGQFHFAARRAIDFPDWGAGNVLRGALGYGLRDVVPADRYARIFEPAARGSGPSGLTNSPRPFVIRAAALNGRTVQPGERFCFALHLFDLDHAELADFIRALEHWADVLSVDQSEIAIDLDPSSALVTRLRVRFLSPTELKSSGADRSFDFSVLLARARDRVSTLRALYGPGPLQIDFRALAERASSVSVTRNDLRLVGVRRRSSRTGQIHGIGGLIGSAEYEGDLAEFLPLLEAASWTGVGRHCAWGNGHIAIEKLAYHAGDRPEVDE